MSAESFGTEGSNLHSNEDVMGAQCQDCGGDLTIALGYETGNMVAMCLKCQRSVAISVTMMGLRKARRREMEADASLKIPRPFYASGCQDGPVESG